MIASALKLCLLGVDKWDDVDRWVRNQFAEGQLTDINWLTDGHLELRDSREMPGAGSDAAVAAHGTTDRVPQRVLGSFSGWPSANDLVQGQGWSIMHCCTGNATRGIYYVWENILKYDQGTLRVNLLLNRASRWADLDSHIPYRGRVDLAVKQDLDLEIRIPEWVSPEEARCAVNGQTRPLVFRDRYALVGAVRAGDEVVLEFPIPERTDRLIIEKHKYSVTRRGNDVVHIEPQGHNRPLYQRGHYRQGKTLWKKVTRFVPDQEIRWT